MYQIIVLYTSNLLMLYGNKIAINGMYEIGLSISDNMENFQNIFNGKKQRGNPPKFRIVFHIYIYVYIHRKYMYTEYTYRVLIYIDILRRVNMYMSLLIVISFEEDSLFCCIRFYKFWILAHSLCFNKIPIKYRKTLVYIRNR